MPTYEYECTKCGYRFEFFQNMSEKVLNECPKCASFVKRLIGSGVGIIFKGPGFYATDYKAKVANDGKTCPVSSRDNPSCRTCNAKADGKQNG